MISIRQDPNGSHIMRWPETPSDILLLARRYVARQSALPPDQQMADILATVQSLLTQAEAVVDFAVTGEAERASASETFRQKMEQARALITLIVQRLRGQYAHNLADLERWGLPTQLGARGVTVRKPTNPTDSLAFLRTYVAKETSLPPTSRIADPSLATVQALLNELEDAYYTRAAARDQRETGNHQRIRIFQDLSDWLEIAGLILAKRNGGVTPALQAHGFTVVEYSPRGNAPVPPPVTVPPIEPPEAS